MRSLYRAYTDPILGILLAILWFPALIMLAASPFQDDTAVLQITGVVILVVSLVVAFVTGRKL